MGARDCIEKSAIAAPISFTEYDYKVVVCSNGLKVLLVSSDKVDKSACAIGVGVGSLGDPRDYQGLAHFCEHMLFMGTARYPDEQEYQQYVQQNGGMTNAYTANMETVYYATVKPEALDGLIDRTVEFFVSPSFNANSVDREVEAVNSEHEKNLQDDSRRKYHLQKFLSNPKHPFSYFGTGSNETLRRLDDCNGDKDKSLKNLRDALLSFHDTNYSSNNMAAVVIGCEPIEQLEKMVIDRVERIANKNVRVQRGKEIGAPERCFTPEYLGVLVDVTPVKEGDRKLDIRWALPDQIDYYRCKPLSFISHILGHEGEGSVLSILKKRGIATSLFAGVYSENNGQSLFTVSIDLKDDEQFNDANIIYIVKLIIGVLSKLSSANDEALKDLIEDEAKVNFLRWKYRPLFAVDELVTEGVRNLLVYPPAEVFEAAYINSETNVRLVKDHIDWMMQAVKNNEIIIWRVGTKFATTKEEPVYKTKYELVKLPKEWASEWQPFASMPPETILPWLHSEGYQGVEKNKFVPSKYDLKSPANGAAPDVLDPPELVKNGPVEVWHKLETSFKLPQFIFGGRIIPKLLRPSNADLNYMAHNEITYAKMKEQYNSANTITELAWPARVALYYAYQRGVMESVNDKLYDARLAGVIYNTSVFNGVGRGPVGLDFAIGGFDDKGEEVMKTFITSSSEFNVNAEHMTTALTQLVTSFTNKCKTTDPYVHVINKACDAACVSQWDNKDILEALKCLTPPLTDKFLKKNGRLNPELFDGATMVGSIVGNITKEEVEKIYANPEYWQKLIPRMEALDLRDVKDRLNYKDFCFDGLDLRVKADGKAKLNIACVKIPTLNQENPNGAVVLSLQSADDDYETVCMHNLMTIWLGDKFFDDLRTKQTLGYVVAMPLREYGNRANRCFLTQSTRTTEYVLSRMLNFIQEKLLNNEGEVGIEHLDDEEFDMCRNAAISQLLEKPKEIGTSQDRIYNEVITGRCDFARRQKQIEFFKSLSKSQFEEALKTIIPGNWLAVLCYPENKESFELELDSLNAFKWCNIYQVKNLKDLIYNAVI